MKLTREDLSPDQVEAYDSMLDWVHGDAVTQLQLIRGTTSLLRVGGFAGTGKTSVLGVFAKQLADEGLTVAYVAYTGRASSVLRRKLAEAGVETTTLLRRGEDAPRQGFDNLFGDMKATGGPPRCSTIHKLLYRPVIDKTTEELRGWVKRNELDRTYDLIVVDEASMVSDEILQDIQVHGVPLLAVGDHGQLPPVMASGKLMQDPDLRLEKIHRQAEGNPIIALSRHIREAGYLKDFDAGGGVNDRVAKWSKGHTGHVLTKTYNEAKSPLDVGVLCWTNRMRVKLNGSARTALGHRGPPRHGEVVIALKNKPPVYNGMRGVLVGGSETLEQPWLLHADIEFPDEGIWPDTYTLCAPQFGREKVYESVEELRERGIPVFSMKTAGDFYDWGYALTVHKTQGSQFDHVVLYIDRPEDPYNEDYRRWCYTAVTRAVERLTILR